MSGHRLADRHADGASDRADDAMAFTPKDPDRLAVITQTTLSVDDTREVMEALRERFPELEQRKMFGYPAAFVAAGHMVTGLHGASWIVRLGEDEAAQLRRVGGADFEPMPGRPMKGFVSLPTDILADDDALGEWIARARRHIA